VLSPVELLQTATEVHLMVRAENAEAIRGARRGADAAAEAMIRDNARVNGAFYVAPAYSYAQRGGAKFRVIPLERFWGLLARGLRGVPQQLPLAGLPAAQLC
jgi:hypothetical protein